MVDVLGLVTATVLALRIGDGGDGRTNGCPKRSIFAKDGWLPLPA
jgi:hypothetical protein